MPWQKGQSGNPTGRAKINDDWREWCRQFVADHKQHILERAVENDGLLQFLIEQAHGKSAQRLEVSRGTDALVSVVELRQMVDEIEANEKHLSTTVTILPEKT